MQIDYIAGVCKPYDKSAVSISSEEIIDVQKISFSFLDKTLEFVCLTSIQRYFFYKDERTYIEIQRLIYDNPGKIKPLLLKYYSASGLMKDLLVALYSAMCRRYCTMGYRHLEKCVKFDASPNHFDLGETYDPMDERTAEIVAAENDDLYEALCLLMPQNLPKKRMEIAEKKRLEEKQAEKQTREQKYADAAVLTYTILKTYDKTTNFSKFFESLGIVDKTNIEVLYAALVKIEKQRHTLNELCEENFISPEKGESLAEVLNEVSTKVAEQVRAILDKERSYEFGSIPENKSKLRLSINKLGFAELLKLICDYQKQEAAFLRRKEQASQQLEKESYDPYIDLYRFGIVLLNDRLNQLNRNKAKHKHIPQDILDQAMCFYYDTHSISNAYETQRKEKYAQEKEGGDIGESKVREALKWLDSSYVQIQPLSRDYAGKPCIYLQNPDYLNIKQEYDHILVGKTGIFSIETKNYKGKLIIDKYGNWRRILQDGKEVGVKNPIEQVRKHEKVLKSFLGDSINISSIICIANDSAIIEGVENSPLPIIKSDLLVEFMEHCVSEKPQLSEENIQSCVKSIYEHMIKS